MTERKIVIVGGVAGGASAAARLRRLDENAEIVMFERGSEISYANCGLPYYIGGVIGDRRQLLVQTPEAMRRRFNIDVRTLSEVIGIDRNAKTVQVMDYQTGETYAESYDALILSPGANPIKPQIPGADLPNVFSIRNIPDTDRIKEWVDLRKPCKAVIIGGGFIGLEMAENLVQRNIDVTLVELSDQVMGPLDKEMAAHVHRHLRQHGVKLLLSEGVMALTGKEHVESVRLNSGQELAADMVVFGAGARPEVTLAQQAGLTLGVTGAIQVDEHLRTSDSFIYAIGDAIEVKTYVGGVPAFIPLAGPANKQGRMAADIICGRQVSYEGTLGTSIAKVFDLAVATTGLNEKMLQRIGRKYEVSYTHPAAYATYYPGGTQMAMKLIFDPDDGLVLGAQIVGTKGVDKRIDVLAASIRTGQTVFDLQKLELAYAPPFSSAKDPVNMAGYVAGNIVNRDVEVVQWHQLDSLRSQGAFIIDVRTPAEIRMGAIEGAVNIQVDDLRDELERIPKDKTIVLYCRVGLRAYIGARILMQQGYSSVKNLSGGWLTYDPAVNG